MLTVLGCSSSLALALVLASPASASPTAPADVEQTQTEAALIAPAQGNPLTDALGCGCASCQMRQSQPSF
ncbi:hypothetical protein [Vasconcelosia minhoensis]|nr:hypothetical protein [Romeria gracilis]